MTSIRARHRVHVCRIGIGAPARRQSPLTGFYAWCARHVPRLRLHVDNEEAARVQQVAEDFVGKLHMMHEAGRPMEQEVPTLSLSLTLSLSPTLDLSLSNHKIPVVAHAKSSTLETHGNQNRGVRLFSLRRGPLSRPLTTLKCDGKDVQRIGDRRSMRWLRLRRSSVRSYTCIKSHTPVRLITGPILRFLSGG